MSGSERYAGSGLDVLYQVVMEFAMDILGLLVFSACSESCGRY